MSGVRESVARFFIKHLRGEASGIDKEVPIVTGKDGRERENKSKQERQRENPGWTGFQEAQGERGSGGRPQNDQPSRGNTEGTTWSSPVKCDL